MTAMTLHQKPLVEDTDYLIIEREALVTVANPKGGQTQRPTTTVSLVYLASENAERYMCTKCNRFTHEKSASVIAHNSSAHRDRSDKVAGVERKAKAFDLLPQGMQESLLKRLDAGEAPAEKPAKKTPTRIKVSRSKYGRQPLADLLVGPALRRESVARAANMTESNLVKIARGDHATGLSSAQLISTAVGKPLVEIFTKTMLTAIARRS